MGSKARSEIISYFELGIINAHEIVFPNARTRLRLFRTGQNVYRFVHSRGYGDSDDIKFHKGVH